MWLINASQMLLKHQPATPVWQKKNMQRAALGMSSRMARVVRAVGGPRGLGGSEGLGGSSATGAGALGGDTGAVLWARFHSVRYGQGRASVEAPPTLFAPYFCDNDDDDVW